jgi:sulfate permease, SulP family
LRSVTHPLSRPPLPPPLRPALLPALRAGYARSDFVADLRSGTLVAVVALPLSIAFAVASGLPPQFGLYTAIVAGASGAFFSGARLQITGPTAALTVLVFGVVQGHGVSGLAVATLLAGGILVALGVARMGSVIKYIPFPVVTGFTSGIAVVILSAQVRDLLGLRMEQIPTDFLPRWGAYAAALNTATPMAVALGVGTIALLILWPRVTRSVPAHFLALGIGIALAPLLGPDVETLGSRFGGVQLGMPSLTLPPLSLEIVRAVLPSALAIAILGAVVSLMSAVVADGMTGDRHDSNQELIAQGIANLLSPLLGGMPATGALARTATNIRSGGRTPLSGVAQALVLLLIGLFAAPLVGRIPMAVLSGILTLVAWNMGNWSTFFGEFRGPRSDLAVLLSTFALTVFVDLIVAIEVGMVLAALLFMRRMAEVTEIRAEEGTLTLEPWRGTGGLPLEIPAGVVVYEIDGPLFFGAAQKFRETLDTVARRPRALILRMRKVPTLDSTALNALRQLCRRARQNDIAVVLSGVRAQPRALLERAGLLAELGEENVVASVEVALDRVREILAADGESVGR